MTDLIARFIAYALSFMGGAVPEYPVTVHWATSQELCELQYGYPCTQVYGADQFHGLYTIGGNIYLAEENVDLSTPWGQSVVLHELVHYIQDANPDAYACIGEKEREAYEIQMKWLQDIHGINATEDGYINGLFMVMVWQTGCDDLSLWLPGK